MFVLSSFRKKNDYCFTFMKIAFFLHKERQNVTTKFGFSSGSRCAMKLYKKRASHSINSFVCDVLSITILYYWFELVWWLCCITFHCKFISHLWSWFRCEKNKLTNCCFNLKLRHVVCVHTYTYIYLYKRRRSIVIILDGVMFNFIITKH